ncbi:MAG TPA: hypothetical protein VN794_12880 [Methylomirabilota bacterium]|nr:hypothetical protein [Methylomirabilota bacterium]
MADDEKAQSPTQSKEPVPGAAPKNPAGGDGGTSGSVPSAALTPEEQMALYENELKETDWGHQPC